MTAEYRKLVLGLKEYPEGKAKEEICQIGKLLFDKGFVVANDGNISIRISEDEIITTPTRVSKGFLTPEMLVKVNRKGEVLEGRLKPSSELKMHLRVYEERPDVRAVVHAHPPYATAYAVAGIPLDQAMMPEAVVLVGTVPIAKYGTPSTEEVPNAIAVHVKNHQALLLENHGALTWSDDPFSAYFLMESVEFISKVNFIVRQLGKERELSRARVAELVDIKRKLGIKGETPTGVDCKKGEDVCENPNAQRIYRLTSEELQRVIDKAVEGALRRWGR